MNRFLLLLALFLLPSPALAGASLTQSLAEHDTLACPGVFLRDVVSPRNDDIIAHRVGDLADFESVTHFNDGSGRVIESNTMGASFALKDIQLYDCVETNCRTFDDYRSCDLGNKAFECRHIKQGLHVDGGFMCDKIGKRQH